jgi:DNA-binding transcriptional ArsR family regulator
MVNYRPLDQTFAALADPTRRALLAHLRAAQPLTVSQLSRPFAVSLPAIMKHLDVLARAGLVTRTKVGREVRCELVAEPLGEALAWLADYRAFWSGKLDRLAKLLEEQTWQSDPGSRSNATTRRRRRKSS